MGGKNAKTTARRTPSDRRGRRKPARRPRSSGQQTPNASPTLRTSGLKERRRQELPGEDRPGRPAARLSAIELRARRSCRRASGPGRSISSTRSELSTSCRAAARCDWTASAPVRAGDLIGNPAGAEAHQIVDTGRRELRYLGLLQTSNRSTFIEYPGRAARSPRARRHREVRRFTTAADRQARPACKRPAISDGEEPA